MLADSAIAPSTRLRVAYTIEQCWHRVPGGTAVAAIETARALLDEKDILLTGVAARHGRPPPVAWTPPIPVLQHGLPRIALYESWHRLRRPPVQKAVGDTDVIHATTIAIPPPSAPLVVTIHDLLWRKDPKMFTRRGVSFFERGLELALRDAAFVLCAADVTVEDCVAAGFDRPRLRKVPLGVVTSPAKSEDVAVALSRHGLDKPYLLWVGTLEPRKNLTRLIAAFDSLDTETDLVLIGPKGWKGSISPRDPDRVKSLGFVPRNELGALYAGATAFCFPSLYEGFGFPVLEAMAQGTPVVTSRGTSTEEIAGDAAVLVDPRDEKDIARGLTQILDDEATRARLMAAGPERARLYTWDRTASLIADIYREAVT